MHVQAAGKVYGRGGKVLIRDRMSKADWDRERHIPFDHFMKNIDMFMRILSGG